MRGRYDVLVHQIALCGYLLALELIVLILVELALGA
jgi:hypothetical protein